MLGWQSRGYVPDSESEDDECNAQEVQGEDCAVPQLTATVATTWDDDNAAKSLQVAVSSWRQADKVISLDNSRVESGAQREHGTSVDEVWLHNCRGWVETF